MPEEMSAAEFRAKYGTGQGKKRDRSSGRKPEPSGGVTGAPVVEERLTRTVTEHGEGWWHVVWRDERGKIASSCVTSIEPEEEA